ncbi:Oligomerization domain-containing protein [Scheffersomyces xylosifermentans]|uniref:Oligomerization domain-containing protein n=1 Tax=Scheffersomyces xylosifermentans TaxID=1304137 RepID=UPI00315C795D
MSRRIIRPFARIRESVPWFLRQESASPLIETNEIELPTVPENSPQTVQKFLKLLAEEYGLKDLQLFDMTILPEEHPSSIKNQPSNYIIICTGKSEKHIFKAASELRLYIKHNYEILPAVEGVVSNGTSPAARRRLLRRVRKGASATDNDYGKVPNSWVMCDTKVDNVFVHILTQERRSELNLESLWCPEEEQARYLGQETVPENSDDIFIGVRRNYHTMTPFMMQFRKQNHTNRLIAEDLPISTQKVSKYRGEFDLKFEGSSLESYRTKFQFYRTLHLLDPTVVSFQEVSDSILEKYISLNIYINHSAENISKEKVGDVISYMKLLVDSPEMSFTGESVGIHIDELFDKLSRFLSSLLTFSDKEVDILSHKEFFPLLWRLSIVEQNEYIGPDLVSDIISGEKEIPEGLNEENGILQASNRARDVTNIIKYHTELNHFIPEPSLKELILFTYGNAGKWEKFWKEWDVSFGFLASGAHNESPMHSWTRLVIYLACRNEKSSLVHFLHNYWSSPSSGKRSLIEDFQAHGGSFSSVLEKDAFVAAMTKILNTVNNGSASGFAEVETIVNQMK